jgi:hypothetical protein
MKTALPVLLKLANHVEPGSEPARARFALLQLCSIRAPVWFQYACSALMATNA